MGMGVVDTASRNQQPQKPPESEKRGTLRQQIARAKQRGEKYLNQSGLVAMYEEVAGLDTVLSKYDLVEAQLIEEKGYVGENDLISSWCKFKVTDTISRASGLHSQAAPPPDLLPLGNDEILVPRSGGQVLIDGVLVTLQEANFPAFQKSKKYLLFLLVDRERRVGIPGLGPSGVILVKDDATLEAVSSHTFLKQEMEKRYGKSLKEIKENLR